MLLDRIDIDNHGPLTRVELGPFCEHLNVVCAPEGSGKTAIARLIRDSLVKREYPLGMMSSSSGRVVWADRNGKIHCRREQDGTATGRRTIEFESRGDAVYRFDWLHDSWIDGIADSTDATRAFESIRIPESIVDGIITDTAVTSVSRVIQACLTAGLCDPALFASLPQNRSQVSGLSPQEITTEDEIRRVMRDELARIEAELATVERYSASKSDSNAPGDSIEGFHESLKSDRRRALHSRIAYLESLLGYHATSAQAFNPRAGLSESSSLERTTTDELSRLHDRIWQLRVRHSELTRWLSHLQLDRDLSHHPGRGVVGSPSHLSTTHSLADASLASARTALRREFQIAEIDAKLRREMEDVDGQILRWRRALNELTSLRTWIVNQAAGHYSSSAYRDGLFQYSGAPYTGTLPLSEQVLRRERMNHFLAKLDHYAAHRSNLSPWEFLTENQTQFASAPGGSPWPDEIDLRLEAIIRHIDTLARHYDRQQPSAYRWYQEIPASVTYRHGATLVNSLQSICADLQNVRRQGFQFVDASRRMDEVVELQRSERWIRVTIERLLSYRSGLIRDSRIADLLRYPSWLESNDFRQTWSPWYLNHLGQEINARTRELEQVNTDLERSIAAAADLRLNLRRIQGVAVNATLHHADPVHHADTVAIEEEIARIRAELYTFDSDSQTTPTDFGHPVELQRVTWLKKRRAELVEKLGVPQQSRASNNPLADESSQWLVRLSGGRLRRVDWNAADFTTSPDQTANAIRSGYAKIDGRDEANCPAIDRALGALAIRMAAADLLSRTERSVPLVIETHRELLRELPPANVSGEHAGGILDHEIHSINLAVVAALDDFAKSGRQVILLASDQLFADHIARRGGQVFTIVSDPVQQKHRPLWRPHFGNESYAGPHFDNHQTVDAIDPFHIDPHVNDPMYQSDAFVDRYYDQYFDSLPVGASLADINRNLDTIWQEAYGVSPYASQVPPRPVHDSWRETAPGMNVGSPQQVTAPTQPSYDRDDHWHDGYYYANTYTTAASPKGAAPAGSMGNSQRKEWSDANAKRTTATKKPSPFFLTVDSPIDQAPSADAIAAARLRRLNVTHINHLLNQDPNRLADALGLASVSAATIRRWQSECRLVCQVPQLRGFDARILVGCGVNDARQLSSINPIDLLDRVEAFLATERGQQILLSGTSYELSRITSWIATANVDTDEVNGSQRDHRTVDGRVVNQRPKAQSLGRSTDKQGFEFEFVDDNGEVVRATSSRSKARQRRSGYTDSQSSSRSMTQRSGRNRQNGSRRSKSVRRRRRTESNGESYDTHNRRSAGSRRHEFTQQESNDRFEHGQESSAEESTQRELKFYLHRESPVVDAPSIGEKMAEKLAAVEIHTVDDLINADPTELAEQLGHRRIDAEVIETWQNQAILVCRVPMLRGHDAQLLVAAGVTTPEEVAEYDPAELFELIDPIARSNEGKRIIRGGQLPDLDEITDWITYAAQHRELVAA